MTSDMLGFGRSVLDSQPFSRLIGAELDVFEPGRAEISLVIADHHRQQHGFVHGGVLAYLADNALTYAGGSMLGDCLTAEFKINYLRPAKGERLVARAKVASGGKRLAACTCEIVTVSGDGETVVAIAQGTIARIDGEKS
ncbi:PaaI family thioesterase [Phreatobacter sp.]|uniref:PaaI family thioesterase n=1 Tax=Phreatobacter sp. TaxID=1966341 RepID=UPI0025FB91BA|nr:PaaI family thioesterase [Phreatobacter sp.]